MREEEERLAKIREQEEREEEERLEEEREWQRLKRKWEGKTCESDDEDDDDDWYDRQQREVADWDDLGIDLAISDDFFDF